MCYKNSTARWKGHWKAFTFVTLAWSHPRKAAVQQWGWSSGICPCFLITWHPSWRPTVSWPAFLCRLQGLSILTASFLKTSSGHITFSWSWMAPPRLQNHIEFDTLPSKPFLASDPILHVSVNRPSLQSTCCLYLFWFPPLHLCLCYSLPPSVWISPEQKPFQFQSSPRSHSTLLLWLWSCLPSLPGGIVMFT